MTRKICNRTSIEINSFFREGFSLERWFWLAINIRGSSQNVKIRSGVDNGSDENMREKFRLWTLG